MMAGEMDDGLDILTDELPALPGSEARWNGLGETSGGALGGALDAWREADECPDEWMYGACEGTDVSLDDWMDELDILAASMGEWNAQTDEWNAQLGDQTSEWMECVDEWDDLWVMGV